METVDHRSDPSSVRVRKSGFGAWSLLSLPVSTVVQLWTTRRKTGRIGKQQCKSGPAVVPAIASPRFDTMATPEPSRNLKYSTLVCSLQVAGYVKLARNSLAECFDGTTVETAR